MKNVFFFFFFFNAKNLGRSDDAKLRKKGMILKTKKKINK